MYDNQSGDTPAPIASGTTVYDAAGERVGTVREHNVEGRYLVLAGDRFREDVHVPVSAIQRKETDAVYLAVGADDLSNDRRYEQSPVASSRDAARRSSGADRTDQGDIRLPLHQEELVIGKQPRKVGAVRLHKDVVSEQETATVPVTHEEVTVERFPLPDRTLEAGPDAFAEQDYELTVMGEELIVGKRQFVAEEVRVHKHAVTEQQQVSDTVRKERVTVVGADEFHGADPDSGT